MDVELQEAILVYENLYPDEVPDIENMRESPFPYNVSMYNKEFELPFPEANFMNPLHRSMLDSKNPRTLDNDIKHLQIFGYEKHLEVVMPRLIEEYLRPYWVNYEVMPSKEIEYETAHRAKLLFEKQNLGPLLKEDKKEYEEVYLKYADRLIKRMLDKGLPFSSEEAHTEYVKYVSQLRPEDFNIRYVLSDDEHQVPVVDGDLEEDDVPEILTHAMHAYPKNRDERLQLEGFLKHIKDLPSELVRQAARANFTSDLFGTNFKNDFKEYNRSLLAFDEYFTWNLDREMAARHIAAVEARDKAKNLPIVDETDRYTRIFYLDKEEQFKRERALIDNAKSDIDALTLSSYRPNSRGWHSTNYSRRNFKWPTPVYHHAGSDQESLYHYKYYEPGMIMRRNFYTDFIRQYIDRQPMDLRNVHRILVVARNVLPDNTSDFNDALLGRRTKKHRGESSNA